MRPGRRCRAPSLSTRMSPSWPCARARSWSRAWPRRGALEPVAEPLDPERTVLVTGGHQRPRRARRPPPGRRPWRSPAAAGQPLGAWRARGPPSWSPSSRRAGREVAVRACDVADREQLRELFDAVDPEHPLGAVVHSAGAARRRRDRVADAGSAAARLRPQGRGRLAPARAERGPRALPPSCSSPRSPGLSAAPARATTPPPTPSSTPSPSSAAPGLPRHLVAWGLLGASGWAPASARPTWRGCAAPASARSPTSRGLRCFDAALGRRARPTGPAARRQPRRAPGPGRAGRPAADPQRPGPRSRPRRRAPGGLAAERLRDRRPRPSARRSSWSWSGAQVAAVLGHGSAAEIEPERAFKELGFDSLAAVELRNRLAGATGAAPAATVVFDYPSREGLARHLLAEGQRAARTQGRASAQASRGADRDRRHGLPLPRRGLLTGGLWRLVAAGGDAIGRSPPTAAGTSSASMAPTPRPRHRPIRARAASSPTPATSTPASSRSARARRWRSTPSSDSSSKPAGRRWKTPGSTPRPARQRDRRLRRGDVPGLRGGRSGRRTGMTTSVDLRPGRLRARPRGPGDDRRHRLLLLAGGDAPGGAGAAGGGVRPRPGGRGDGARHPLDARPSSPPSAASLPTGAARPSPTAPTASASRRASACWSWSASPTPSATATGCSPRSAAPPSTRTAPPTASPPPTDPRRSG